MSEEFKQNRKLLLIDGNSIINRSFFALAGRSNLTAPDGTPTGALNTYLNTLFKFIEDCKPTHICTLFDVREKTFRHHLYDGYKAKRKGMPDELAVQMPILKEILDAMRMVRYELPGYEADDLIGTYAKMAEKDGFDVCILSGDKDDFQLIDSHTVVLMPVAKAGKTTTEVYDLAALMERFHISPEEFITLKAIMGDPSDNIPGVRGIGEKGAIDLVTKYKTLDNIYTHIDELSSGIQNKLLENKDMAYLSYDLSKICCEAPVTMSLDALSFVEPDRDKLASLFYRLGFRSQIKKWNLEGTLIQSDTSKEEGKNERGSIGPSVPAALPEIRMNPSREEFADAFLASQHIQGNDFTVCIDTTVRGTYSCADAYILISLSNEWICAISAHDSKYFMDILLQNGIGSDPDGNLPVGYSVKNRFRWLPYVLPFDSCFDTEIAGYILNQIEGNAPSFEMLYEHATEDSYPRHAISLEEESQGLVGQSPMELLLSANESGAGDPVTASECSRKDIEEAAWRTILCRRMAFFQKAKITEHDLAKLVYEIEMPLVLKLDRMERTGVLVDGGILQEIHGSFEAELQRLSLEIYKKSEETFNILSPKQLGQVLFEKLHLPSGRKNSSGTYSTDSDELMRLIDAHPVVRDILQYRQISKLDSTFVLGLQKVIDPTDGRVHSNFSQATTNTGRLSSADPNLQNIPIRSDLGSQIRKAFIATDGYVLLDADYSQIELRLLAHLSQDTNMLDAFLHNEDIHVNTASNLFHVSRDKVQPSMRSAAKTVNFSIVYGISDFGLAQDLGVSYQEAHHYIESYYAQYPMIRAYLDSLKKMGYDEGYVETLYGRRRIVKELTSPNRNIRSFGERAAMNTPVQGTAADIIKIAMNRVSRGLIRENLDARLILQVHDELLVECKADHAAKASVVLKEAMEGAARLSVPLTAEVNQGASWYACKA
jgi:DNA polymerase-1